MSRRLKKLRNTNTINPEKINYTTLEDHAKAIRAKLTGEPDPGSLDGKVPNPIFTQTEEAIIVEEVIKKLQGEGYVQCGEIWRLAPPVEQDVQKPSQKRESRFEY